MKYDNNIKTVDDIPQGKYVGYFWGSGDSAPILVNNEYPDFNKRSSDSLFIQEAMLWNEETGISIMINHTGKQQIHRYELAKEELTRDEDLRVYESNRLQNRKLKFLQYWKEEEDEYCNGLPVLKMKAQIFVGFDK